MEDLIEFKTNKINYSGFKDSFVVNGNNLVLLNDNCVERYLIQPSYDGEEDYLLLEKYSKIVNIPKLKLFIVLVGYELKTFDYEIQSLKLTSPITDCEFFCIDDMSDDVYLATVNSLKNLQIFLFDKDYFKPIHTHSNVNYLAAALSFPNFCFIDENEYRILNCLDSSIKPLFSLEDDNTIPLIVATAKDEFLIYGPSSLGLFCNQNGPLPWAPLTLPQSIEKFGILSNNIIVENDEFLIIYSKSDQKQLKTIPIDKDKHMFTVDQENTRLFCIGCQSIEANSIIRVFGKEPWHKTCQRLISTGLTHRADQIKLLEDKKINDIGLLYPEMIDLIQIQHQNITCKLVNLLGFMHLTQMDLTSAFNKFSEGHLDPRELLVRLEGLSLPGNFTNDPFYTENNDSNKPIITFEEISRNLAQACDPSNEETIHQAHMQSLKEKISLYLRKFETKSVDIMRACNWANLKFTLDSFSLLLVDSVNDEEKRRLFTTLSIEAGKDSTLVEDLLQTTPGMEYPLAIFYYSQREQDDQCYLKKSLDLLYQLVMISSDYDENKTKNSLFPGPLVYLAGLINGNLTFQSCPTNERELFEDILLTTQAFSYAHACLLLEHLKKLQDKKNLPKSLIFLPVLIDYLPDLEKRYQLTLSSSFSESEAFNGDLNPGRLLRSDYLLDNVLIEPMKLTYLESKMVKDKCLTLEEHSAYALTLCCLAIDETASYYGSKFLDYLKASRNVVNPDGLLELIHANTTTKGGGYMIFEKAILHGIKNNHVTAVKGLSGDFNLVREYIRVFLSNRINNNNHGLFMQEMAECIMENFSVDELIQVTNEFGDQFDVSVLFDHLSEVKLEQISQGLIKCLTKVNHDLINAQIVNSLSTMSMDKVLDERLLLNGDGGCLFDKKTISCCLCGQFIINGLKEKANDVFVVDHDNRQVFHKHCFDTISVKNLSSKH